MARPGPVGYFRRQCWISFDADESTIPFTATSPYVGADRIVWATDYRTRLEDPGHHQGAGRDHRPAARDQQHLIAGANCRALYGI